MPMISALPSPKRWSMFGIAFDDLFGGCSGVLGEWTRLMDQITRVFLIHRRKILRDNQIRASNGHHAPVIQPHRAIAKRLTSPVA